MSSYSFSNTVIFLIKAIFLAIIQFVCAIVSFRLSGSLVSTIMMVRTDFYRRYIKYNFHFLNIYIATKIIWDIYSHLNQDVQRVAVKDTNLAGTRPVLAIQRMLLSWAKQVPSRPCRSPSH